MLATARCVIAASLDGEFSVEVIAERTGLTEDATRAVLNSPAYQQLVRDEMQQIVAHTLVRGTQAMAKIIESDQVSHKDRIAAHRAIVQTYESIRGSLAPPSESPANEFDSLMRQLREQKKLKIEDPNASAR